MTGGSLGLRLSGSCGSLQQQAQNGYFYLPRRSSKTFLIGYREKERLLPSSFRYLSRRKVGMLILAAFALLVLMTGFFTVNKEDDYEGSGLRFDIRYLNESYALPFPSSGKDSWKHNSNGKANKVLVCNGSTSWDALLNASPVGSSSSAVTVLTNPCKNFAFSPPPPNSRRPGPRRRNDSSDIKESMTVHCGSVKGCRPGYQTGFYIDVADLELLEQSQEVIVASAIFGNYDVIQQPRNIGDTAKKNIPFLCLLMNSSILGSEKQVGLWRIIVVHNVPYADSRRNGKVPKLLLHRLFPNTRFSIWIDGKLQLVVDPYQLLERFLWRQNATFAISRHYTRFDVFEEAEANKAGGKYDNTSIDYQIEFYKNEGLTHYTTTKLPITSDVPEGCVIIREHIAITNLFSCLWFNEVDRFTSRDQLSFSTVRDKVIAKVNWSINMFLDCERRNFVIQAYHKELLDQRANMATVVRSRSLPPPPVLPHEKLPPKKIIIRRAKDKKPSSRRRRRVIPKIRENLFI